MSDLSQINVLNPAGSRIFELADGNHSMAEIVTVIISEYDVASEQAQADVVAFLEELARRQILVFDE